MHYLKLYPSKYLSVADIPEESGELTITIDRYAREEVKNENGVEEKTLLYFSDFEKPLVLNKTNANSIALKHGPDVTAWKGKAVTFRESVTTLKGQERPCVRVK
jgi:hypothetical protein